MVNREAILIFFHRFIRAVLVALQATRTEVLINSWLGERMHIELATFRRAPHADVLDCTPKSARQVAFEVRNAHKSVDHREQTRNLGTIDILIINTIQSVGNDNRHKTEPVIFGELEVRITAKTAARVERCCIGQEGPAAGFLYHISKTLIVDGPNESNIAIFAKVSFDRTGFFFLEDTQAIRFSNKFPEETDEGVLVLFPQIEKVHSAHGISYIVFS
jgi:hypothetical protein